jgi:hypothetical protein
VPGTVLRVSYRYELSVWVYGTVVSFPVDGCTRYNTVFRTSYLHCITVPGTQTEGARGTCFFWIVGKVLVPVDRSTGIAWFVRIIGAVQPLIIGHFGSGFCCRCFYTRSSRTRYKYDRCIVCSRTGTTYWYRITVQSGGSFGIVGGTILRTYCTYNLPGILI